MEQGRRVSTEILVTVYFHGHFDVVPAQNLAQFRPQRRDGKISGRGAADMKGGLVSMLYGAAAARDLACAIASHAAHDARVLKRSDRGHLEQLGREPQPRHCVRQ